MVERIRQIIPRIANHYNLQTGLSEPNDEIKTALQVKIFG